MFFLGVMPSLASKLQLIPALLAANFLSLLIIFILTALFGRVYCSFLCPLGIMQDMVIWLKRKRKGTQARFSYSSEWLKLRYGILTALTLAFVLGFSMLPILLDPYSIYGRMIVHLLTPVWQTSANYLTVFFDKYDLYLIEKYDMYWQGITAFVISAVYFLGISFLSWRYGRLYCNTLCPVGTILGTLSRFSLFRISIDKDKCSKCGMCAMKCKAGCMDTKEQQIDSSRCINCFDCIEICPRKAIRFKMGANEPALSLEPVHSKEGTANTLGISRRKLLLTSVITMAAMGAAVMKAADAAMASASPQGGRGRPVSPPGAQSREHLHETCTACHLCVSKCPNQVLKPAAFEYGIVGIMQPVMDFTRGYCEYDCNRCGKVCPTHAIQPLKFEEKQKTKIGYAVYNQKQCVVITDDVHCGNCAVHCPMQAITMVEYNGKEIPSIDRSLCIGCGSCEYHCPANPRAIHVVGLGQHEKLT